MRFRTYCFSCSMLLCIGVIVLILLSYLIAPYENDTQIAGGVTGACFWSLCPAGLALVFALLAWRNAAGQKAQERHAELIHTLKGKPHDGS